MDPQAFWERFWGQTTNIKYNQCNKVMTLKNSVSMTSIYFRVTAPVAVAPPSSLHILGSRSSILLALLICFPTFV